jgi:protein-disulfide isomerase/uncharacterized membrane protein/rhodanese-related sulfurtransferase
MFSRKQTAVLLVLLGVGFLIALKLFHIDYMVNYSGTPYKSFCNINSTFNCDAVASSPYSSVLGIPVAFIGMVANLFLMAFLWIGPRLEHIRERMKQLYLGVFSLYTLGCIALATVSFLFVPALCFVCMAYWAVSIGTFGYIFAISDYSRLKPKVVLKSIWDGVSHHKVVVAGLLAIFLSANAFTGYELSRLGCDKKGTAVLECEHFDPATHTAFLGREGGKLDVVIYTDFQCPWCKHANLAIMEMIKKYEKQIRFIRKDFPLDIACNPLVKRPFHPMACKAAFFAKCAGEQGKYWEYHDELYKNQEILSDEIFENIGKMLSLNVEQLKTCAASERVRASVAKEIDEALSYKVRGTPSFRIFGELLTGMINEQVLDDYLATYPTLKPDVLKRMITSGGFVQIVDIRAPKTFNAGHIEGALNLTADALKTQSVDGILKADQPTVLYDQDGLTVDQAFEVLKSRGFSMPRTLLGGYDNWLRSKGER